MPPSDTYELDQEFIVRQDDEICLGFGRSFSGLTSGDILVMTNDGFIRFECKSIENRPLFASLIDQVDGNAVQREFAAIDAIFDDRIMSDEEAIFFRKALEAEVPTPRIRIAPATIIRD